MLGCFSGTAAAAAAGTAAATTGTTGALGPAAATVKLKANRNATTMSKLMNPIFLIVPPGPHSGPDSAAFDALSRNYSSREHSLSIVVLLQSELAQINYWEYL